MKMEEARVRIKFLTELLGTVAKDPEVYKTFIESKKPGDQKEEEYLTIEKVEEKGWTGFHKDKQGLFLYEYVIKGFLKHAGNVLKDSLKIKALKSKIDDYVFIQPRKIYLAQDEPDGYIERPLRAMTMQGPRVTLARSDYIKPDKEIEFGVILFPHKEIKWSIISDLLKYGEHMGLGQFRNGGYGRFKVVAIVRYGGVRHWQVDKGKEAISNKDAVKV
jgi:hypothetical protein